MIADTPGTVIDERYRLLERAGRGGMAEVWKAELLAGQGVRRPVALKRLLRHLVHLADHRAMFVEEARLTALLSHPNIAQVYDFGEDELGLYIVMEWVEGLSLRDLQRVCKAHSTRPSPALAAAITIEVLRALDAAHTHHSEEDDMPSPIIHRDVSPSNVLLSVRGVIKLADFGLARAMHRAGMGGLTPAGVVKGKLAYLPPEVLRGQKPSPAADVYSAAVVLWETLAGRRLFEGLTDYAIIERQLKNTAIPSILGERPDTPVPLAKVVDRSLAADPEQRYPSALAMLRALSDGLRLVPERTDCFRLAREFGGARAAWQTLRPRLESASLPPAPMQPRGSDGNE